MSAADEQPGGADAATRRGLTSAEAAARLAAEGPNLLPREKRRNLLNVIRDVLKEPMLLLLLGGGIVYLALGDRLEALVLLLFAMLSILITTVQERRTERVLEALRDLSSPRALVIRDGRRQRIPGPEVVRGDLLVLAEGDRVPADALLREANELMLDESLLTGESVPVSKRPARSGETPRPPGGEDLPTVYSGTLVVRGEGLAETTATGPRTEIGAIGQSLALLDTEPPRLRRETTALVRLFAIIGLAVSLVVVLLYGLFRGSWLDAMLAGIALGMSMLPEEFPVVLTVFMAMGAWRISQARVLTRRAAAIETLGSATVLCTDKTGTLTENRMEIARVVLPGGQAFDAGAPMPPEAAAVVATGALASAPQPVDPMDRAFHSLAGPQDGLRLEASHGLRPELMAVSNLWVDEARPGEALLACKGAPEAVMGLSGLSEAGRAAMAAEVERMAAEGLRVLAVGHARSALGDAPGHHGEAELELLGLVGLADPLRTNVPAAVAECRSAGIRVVMITGDYPATARSIAASAGIEDSEPLTGADLSGMDDAALRQACRNTHIFARIQPQQKLRIVSALKADGEVVAMTGDGVNDAPALKAAHIGIAMGGRGTDVAREASALVLLDDDFGSIVKAIRLGRRIRDNLGKAVAFILAVHVPIAGLALLPLAMGLPLILGPIHIAFLEMLIDPVCSLAFEAEEEEHDIMSRPPRAPDERLFPAPVALGAALQGLLAFGLVALVYVVGLGRGIPEDEARALAFFTLVLSIIALILVNRRASTRLGSALLRHNRVLGGILIVVAGILALSLGWPFLAGLFRFAPLSPAEIGLGIGGAFTLLLLLEGLKWLRQRPLRRGAA